MVTWDSNPPELGAGDVVTVWADPERRARREGVAVLERFRNRPVGREGLEVWRVRLLTFDAADRPTVEFTHRAVRAADKLGHLAAASALGAQPERLAAELVDFRAHGVQCPACGAHALEPCSVETLTSGETPRLLLDGFHTERYKAAGVAS